MKAAYIRLPGPPETIQYGDLPDPIVAPGQALVKMGAVSVNPIDTYIRNGANYWPLPDPYVIGSDLAGTVVAVAEGVKQVSVGQRVWCSNQGLMGRQGTFSELCAVDAHWLNPTPDKVADTDAAATALVGITAHLGLFRSARLQPGETIFVRGGVGGVGSMVLQMAKSIGARVITTAGSDEKAYQCQQLGADVVINYAREDVAQRIKSVAPNGVHVFWETLRDPDFNVAVDVMAERGRMVLMAGRDARPPFPVGPFYVKGCSLLGVVMFKATPEEQRQAANDINHWLDRGQLKAVIDRILPLKDAAEAHRLQEAHTIQKQSSLRGKLVLVP
ncbi:MAG: NADPH:quinone reductase [Pirellulaceae bacterium]|nr:NADPH:quinone reductase [Pirellulaceae bacterium]